MVIYGVVVVVVIIRMSYLSLSMYWQRFTLQKQGIAMWGLCSLGGFLGGCLRSLGVSLVQEWERSSLCVCHITLLCRLVFVHMERR